MAYDLGEKSDDLGWPHVCKHTSRGIMVAARRADAGFTITELMVVVVILSLLAALSTPLFTRDNKAAKGRGWNNVVAQALQRARFQAMGDRLNIHVLLHRTQVDLYRAEPAGAPEPFTRLSSTPGPLADDTDTIAIWGAVPDGGAQPTGQASPVATTVTVGGTPVPAIAEIVFTSLGGTLNAHSWRVYIRNELLPSAHPDASFVISVGGLTGFVSTNDKVTLSNTEHP
jgi:prepilin-type N-terminal cleavage/methylation domain-containing protein